MQLLIGLLGGLIGSIVGGTITWLTSRWTLQRELEHSYDKELRAERLNAYKQLWQLTEALPRHHWPKNPTRSEIRELIERCHTWYFDVGGLFFSQKTKDAYFKVMNALDKVTGRKAGDNTPVTDDIVRDLFDLGERLRLNMAADVGTGLRPRVPSEQLQPAVRQDS